MFRKRQARAPGTRYYIPTCCLCKTPILTPCPKYYCRECAKKVRREQTRFNHTKPEYKAKQSARGKKKYIPWSSRSPEWKAEQVRKTLEWKKRTDYNARMYAKDVRAREARGEQIRHKENGNVKRGWMKYY